MTSENPAPESSPEPERVRMQPVSALVPSHLSLGVFSTGVIVMTGKTEFVLDFVQNLGGPGSVVARVICPHVALSNIVDAIQRNVEGFTERFGSHPKPSVTETKVDTQSGGETPEIAGLEQEQWVGAGMPESKGVAEKRTPTPQDVYDDIKLGDDVVAGSYANGLMIGHTSSEFKLDFLANLYPKSIVTSRVFMSAPQLMQLLQTLQRTLQQYDERT